MKVIVTNTSFMEYLLINVWSFRQQVCIVKIDVFTAGDRWSFMIH